MKDGAVLPGRVEKFQDGYRCSIAADGKEHSTQNYQVDLISIINLIQLSFSKIIIRSAVVQW